MVMSAPVLGPGGRPYTVSELNRLLRRAIETALPRAVAVAGEITNFVHHGSGHMYFALRDGGAILRCVMFRTANQFLRFRPVDGLKVEAHGLVTLYGSQGQVQLQVDVLAPAGRGVLMAAIEERKQRLAQEGLFAPERKRPLPRFPRAVGIVTSPSGAALADLVRLLRRRAPGVRILFAPARVQGDGAAQSIIHAIALQNRWNEAEVLIVGRGGGAIEDLLAFNEEKVVRAIAGSRIPVVSAVGHEVDLTLADLAADRRAATPSHAAEMVVPETRLVWAGLVATRRRLERRVAARLTAERRALSAWQRSYAFRRPAIELKEGTQRLDELSAALDRALRRRHRRASENLRATAGRLPRALRMGAREEAARLGRLAERLQSGGRMATPARNERLLGLRGRLEALGPGQVLRRGYALVRRAGSEAANIRARAQKVDGGMVNGEMPSGDVVSGVAGLATADRLRLDFHDGHVLAEVSTVAPGESVVAQVGAGAEEEHP
jgi:exodeoxyribonuclease VII large subunit